MTSIEPSDTNTLVIVDAVNSSGSGDLFNQEVTVLGNSITISSGTDATYGTHLDITFTGSGHMEKLLDDAVTSVTVDTQALSDKYVVMTVLDPSQTQVIAKKQIGHTDFPQKAVMQFSSGVGQTLRIEAVDGFDLYNVYADAGIAISQPGYKYLGFYSTSSESRPGYVNILEELWLHTSAGTSINHLDTSDFDNDYTNFKYLKTVSNSTSSILFDNDTNALAHFTFQAGQAPGMFFYLELKTKREITSGKYWTYVDGTHDFHDLSVYGTNTDPSTMSAVEQQDISSASSKWTELTSLSTAYVGDTIAYP